MTFVTRLAVQQLTDDFIMLFIELLSDVYLLNKPFFHSCQQCDSSSYKCVRPLIQALSLKVI